jgi:hypothetical protein
MSLLPRTTLHSDSEHFLLNSAMDTTVYFADSGPV